MGENRKSLSITDGLFLFSHMDDLDAALSTELVDSMVVEAVAAEIRAACASCHAVYREQDPTTGDYRLKSGVFE